MFHFFGQIYWNPDPVLIDFGFLALGWYGLLFTTGIVLSYAIVLQGFQRASLADSHFEKFALAIILGMFVGMRLGHFLFYEPTAFVERPVEIILPVSFSPSFHIVGYRGLASHGGVLGILLAVGWFVRRHPKISGAFVLDQLALVAPLAGGFIRLGNLMNSEIVGLPTDVPWAFVFASVDAVPRHPAPLYEAVGYFAIFFLLYHWHRRTGLQQENRGVGLLLVLLFSWRFIVEFFKEDQAAFEKALWFNMGQWLSIPFIVAGIVLLSRRPAEPTEGNDDQGATR